MYHVIGNPQGEAESYRLHDTFSQMLLKDHFQSTQLSEHRLIQVGDLVLMTGLPVLNDGGFSWTSPVGCDTLLCFNLKQPLTETLCIMMTIMMMVVHVSNKLIESSGTRASTGSTVQTV